MMNTSLACLLCQLLVICAWCLAGFGVRCQFIKTDPAPDLQPLFNARANGWIGADVDRSIPLQLDAVPQDHESYLWLFGDTLIGTSSGDTRTSTRAFIHQTVAVVTYKRGTLPTPDNVSFQWGGSYDDPQQIFTPPGNPPPSKEFYWIIQGKQVAKQLMIMAQHVVVSGSGSFGFTVVDTTLIVVQDVNAPVNQWQYKTMPLSNSNATLLWTTGFTTDRTDPSMLYVFGRLSLSQLQSETVLARLPVDAMLNFGWTDAVQYYAYRNASCTTPEWVSGLQFDRYAYLFDGTAEATITYSPTLQQYYTLQVKPFDTPIVAFTAPALTGPWTGQQIYNIPAPFNNKSEVFCYAAKAHPELQIQPTEMIFTFVCNAYNLTTLYQPHAADIYVPQFMRTILY